MKIRRLVLLIITIMATILSANTSNKKLDTMRVIADVANVRIKPAVGAKILFKVPITSTIIGYSVNSEWFFITSLSNQWMNINHNIQGYIHKSTFKDTDGQRFRPYYTEKDISKITDKSELKDYITELERCIAYDSNHKEALEKLLEIYREQNSKNDIIRIQNHLKGNIPILISVPLIDERIVVLGALYPNGDFENYTYSYFKDGDEFDVDTARPEIRRLQMTGTSWWPVTSLKENYDKPLIFPAATYGGFAPNMEEDFLEWIELSPPRIHLHINNRTRLLPYTIYTSQPCSVLQVSPALYSMNILNDSKVVDSIYAWHTGNMCPSYRSKNIKEDIRSLEIVKISNTPFYDMSILFDDRLGKEEGYTRIIIDKDSNKKFIAKGLAGLWFTPKIWNRDIKLTIAYYTSDEKACHSALLDVGINIIMILPDKTIKTHKVILGNWG